MRVLIIVDVQRDFLPGGALPVRDGDAVVPVINGVIPGFEIIVATRDWHPAGHGSFAANHAGRQPGDVVELDGLEQVLWPVHCVQNTPGAELAAALDTRRIERVFDKGTDPGVDSYSGFFDNARRHATGLHAYLETRGVTDVYTVGLATDFCVQATARDALELGYRTHVFADACRAVNLHAGDGDAALEGLRRAGVRVIDSRRIGAAEASSA